ncbi:MAG: PTS sugar transporter subunit IIB [Clostridiales bacterium]|jgi:PTS system ascorbate-specific IIB component|nr:PTS sugar transporter subunit IIB [Clostridiales bacterium]
MKRGLVVCGTGMGSSMMLRFKLEQVIADNKYPIELEHDVLSAVRNYNVDFVVTMADLVDQVVADIKCEVIGIENIMNKDEIKEKLEKLLNKQSKSK